MKKLLLGAAMSILALFCGAAQGSAAGQPDLGFGEDGKVLFPRQTDASLGALLLPDDRVVAAGRKEMLALLPSGEIDRSFGEGGVAPFFQPPSAIVARILHVSADSQGRLVVVGSSTFRSSDDSLETNDTEILVARYAADGRLDLTFGGGDGYVVTDFELPPVRPGTRGVYALGAAVDGDDRILISGERGFAIAYYKGLPLGLEESFVARLTADGEVDSSFARAGVARFPNLYRMAAPVADPSGGVFATAKGPGGDLVLHLLESGAADAGFSGDGRRRLPRGTFGGPGVDTAGRPLFTGHLSGSRKRGVPDGIMVKRLNLDGSLDHGFGRGGAATLRLPRLRGGVLAPDEGGGALVAVGMRRQSPGGPAAMGLARLRPDGRLDRGFGRRGVLEFPFRGRVVFMGTLDARGSSALLGGTRCGEESCNRALARVDLAAG